MSSLDIEKPHLQYFRSLIKELTGINIPEHKNSLLRTRLLIRVRKLQLKNIKKYKEYFTSLDNNKKEVQNLINAVSTNLTSFFREEAQFEFLRNELSNKQRHQKLNIWSAASSTGEEAYSLAMTLDDILGLDDYTVLATDIDTNVLDISTKGVYLADKISNIPDTYKETYLKQLEDKSFSFRDKLKKNIYFRHLNLCGDFPFNAKFDFIFCCNVMIYFDKQTQVDLITRMVSNLNSGGHLLVGLCESINPLLYGLEFVQPSIYKKL